MSSFTGPRSGRGGTCATVVRGRLGIQGKILRVDAIHFRRIRSSRQERVDIGCDNVGQLQTGLFESVHQIAHGHADLGLYG